MESVAGEGRLAYSERIDEALRLAAAAHQEDVRKGTRIPYVMHPFHVALILDRHGSDEDVVIAGILHDVLEDPEYEAPSVQARIRAVVPALDSAATEGAAFKRAVEDYIAGAFGAPVLDLVRHVTEEKRDAAGQPRDWGARRKEQLAALEGATADHCALKAADCLHNLRSLARDFRAHGADVAKRFNAGSEAQLWYYTRVAELVASGLGPGSGLLRELRDALDDFEAALGAAGASTGP
jgi:(p)ppGpp synthase/HD superfamily hydrolase